MLLLWITRQRIKLLWTLLLLLLLKAQQITKAAQEYTRNNLLSEHVFCYHWILFKVSWFHLTLIVFNHSTNLHLWLQNSTAHLSLIQWSLVHLVPKWWPINYSFVCMSISPFCLIFTSKFLCVLYMMTRHQGLINMQTKRIIYWPPFWNKVYVCSSSEMATAKGHMNENPKKGEENRTFEASKTKTIFFQNYLN